MAASQWGGRFHRTQAESLSLQARCSFHARWRYLHLKRRPAGICPRSLFDLTLYGHECPVKLRNPFFGSISASVSIGTFRKKIQIDYALWLPGNQYWRRFLDVLKVLNGTLVLYGLSKSASVLIRKRRTGHKSGRPKRASGIATW